MPVTGHVFAVTRGSFHDGPGVRDVVYLKGCPLRCRWCHNPEGQTMQPQLNYSAVKCIGCGTCIRTCPRSNFREADGKLVIDYGRCAACGLCCDACPTGALSLYGETVDAETLEHQLLRDADHFRRGGGVTFSGGECLLQPDFLEDLLRFCNAHRIHTLIETALCVPEETVKRIIPLADEVYADLKHSDPDRHRDLTGSDNLGILSNLRLLHELGTVFSVRTPVIPDCNDSFGNLLCSARIALEAGAKAYTLLPYNPLGESKYLPIGREFTLPAFEKQNDEEMQRLCDELNSRLGTGAFVDYLK